MWRRKNTQKWKPSIYRDDDYIKAEDISVQEVRILFRYRVKLANFKENQKIQNKGFPFCFVHLDNPSHATQCAAVKEIISVEGDYRKIFLGKILSDISKTRHPKTS